MSSKASWTMMIAVLVVILTGYKVWKHIPPFEQGVHDNVVEAGTNPARADAAKIGVCPAFPADNVWNTPIDTLGKDAHNRDYIESIGAQKGVHPDFGFNLETGMPWTEIPRGTKPVKVAFDYRDDSDLGNYPIPPNPPIENGAASTGDRHILLVDPRKCILYELYDAHALPDGSWKAGSGVKIDLTDNALRQEGLTSADAAGLPILPGLVRYEEVAAGEINHALRFTVPHTQSTFIWPARHKASHDASLKLPPMGTRFRLRADFDISKYSKTNQVIMRALKRYGMFVADNGGAMFISGVSDKRWDDTDLHKLGDMHAEDFEAVDESDWQMLANSGRVDPLSVAH